MPQGTRVTYKMYANAVAPAQGTVIKTASHNCVFVQWDTGAAGLYHKDKLEVIS